jgi:hypothetical protein
LRLEVYGAGGTQAGGQPSKFAAGELGHVIQGNKRSRDQEGSTKTPDLLISCSMPSS